MRVGFNPHKDEPLEKTKFLHQVIIPVYIPDFDGYFKDSFAILKLCINSLIQSVHGQTMITIVNNGSCKEVVAYINQLFDEQKIHEVVHTENLGKINSVIKGLAGNDIKLVTISDADVLFLKNWQNETVQVFNNFPKAGVVGLVPQIRLFEYFSSNLIFENWFSKKLKFTPIKNPEAFRKFYYSIGWAEDYNQDYTRWALSIENNNTRAVVGSGHFVATYKKELFDEIKTYLGFKLGADTERYLDEKPLQKGLWRLTTEDNFAYHMGNVYEDWMTEEVGDNAIPKIEKLDLIPTEKAQKISGFSFFIKNRLFAKFFDKKAIRSYFYKIKGLPKEVARNY